MFHQENIYINFNFNLAPYQSGQQPYPAVEKWEMVYTKGNFEIVLMSMIDKKVYDFGEAFQIFFL